MATPEEVRAFMQNCSNLGNPSEVARGLDAAAKVYTEVAYVDQLIADEMLDRASMPNLIDSIKSDLQHRLLREVVDKGYLPTAMPVFSKERMDRSPHGRGSLSWNMTRLRMAVTTRPAPE